MTTTQAAIYARVSTDRQTEAHTIASQAKVRVIGHLNYDAITDTRFRPAYPR